jgi:hypothetical protein
VPHPPLADADDLPDWEAFVRAAAGVPAGPLLVLMILGRAQRGGPFNVFRYRDLDEPLGEAIAAFQAEGAAPSAFWDLREAGFWEVRDEARFAGAHAPARQALLDGDAAAEVPTQRWEELRGDPARTARLLRSVLSRSWPAEVHGRLLAEVVFDLRVDEAIGAP